MSSKAAIKLMSRFFQGNRPTRIPFAFRVSCSGMRQEESPRVFIEGNVYGMLASSVPAGKS